jgi:hypothetical protein
MLTFNVLHSTCYLGDEAFAGGEHTVENPSAALVRLAGSAHAAGAIDVTEGLDVSHVESQEASEAKLVEAMGEWVPSVYREDGTAEEGYWNGPWYEGHIIQSAADAADNHSAEVGIDVDAPVAEEV